MIQAFIPTSSDSHRADEAAARMVAEGWEGAHAAPSGSLYGLAWGVSLLRFWGALAAEHVGETKHSSSRLRGHGVFVALWDAPDDVVIGQCWYDVLPDGRPVEIRAHSIDEEGDLHVYISECSPNARSGMTPGQRRLREAHLALRALVRMLLRDKRSPRRRSTRFTPSLGRLYVTALCAPFRGARIDHRWATGEWVVTVLLSRDRHAITFETPTLANITDQVRAAILATHGPEALP